MISILTNGPSRSAVNLQEALAAVGITANRIRPTSKLRRGRRTVLNLGCSRGPAGLLLSNSYEAVNICREKRLTLDVLTKAGVPTLEWGETQEGIATTWLEEDGKIVVRTTTTGHSGNGCIIVRRGGSIPAAPLYTRYFRKHAEYRVHFAFGNIILIQQKRKRNNAEQSQEQSLIRTHANGWVFSTQNLSCDQRGYTDRLRALATSAANAVGAGHCAVDILVNHDSGAQVVCEINSCPALEADSTLAAYTAAFRSFLNL